MADPFKKTENTTMSNTNHIIKMISDFNHDPVLHKLRKFLNHKNMFDILGVSRREICHSAFLAWLFDSTEDHGLGALPSSRLLDFIVGDIVSHFSMRKNNTDELNIDYYSNPKHQVVLGKLLLHDYRIIHTTSLVEQSTDDKKRIDILVQYDIRIDGKVQTVNVVIENKIDSLFHDDQLNNYARHVEKFYKDCLNLYVIIAPDTDKALESLTSDKNKEANQYVPLSYQNLLEDILQPSLDKDNLPSRTEFLLKEYINELSKPNTKPNSTSLMAMTKEYRDLLISFYENHRDLLISILEVIASDDKTDPEVRKVTGDTAKCLKKSLNIYINGERIKGMAEFARQVVIYYISRFEEEKGEKPTLQQLREEFYGVEKEMMLSKGVHPFINTTDIKQVKNGKVYRYWNDADVKVFDETTGTRTKIYISNQWKAPDNFVKFFNFVKSKESKYGITVKCTGLNTQNLE